VGLLEVILTSIFVLYGLPLTNAFITALLLRSASFWFPLFFGFVAVQIMGVRNLIAQPPKIEAELNLLITVNK